MANEQIRVGTELATTGVLETQYDPTLAIEANEAFVIVKDFSKASAGKIGNQLYIMKVATAGAQTSLANDMSVAGLTFEQDTEAVVLLSPRFAYAGFGIQKPSQTRFMRSPQYIAGKKQQMLAALRVDLDTQGGLLGTGLATNILGGAGQRITKQLLTQSLGKLRAGAKEKFQMGGMCHLVAYHLQLPDLYAILDITSAEYRGDATNPNVTGRIVRAWGMTVDTSGNISTAGGVAHNMLWVPEAFAVGYNAEPQMMEPQQNGLTQYHIAYAEYGVVEVWDQYACDIQTATT